MLRFTPRFLYETLVDSAIKADPPFAGIAFSNNWETETEQIHKMYELMATELNKKIEHYIKNVLRIEE